MGVSCLDAGAAKGQGRLVADEMDKNCLGVGLAGRKLKSRISLADAGGQPLGVEFSIGEPERGAGEKFLPLTFRKNRSGQCRPPRSAFFVKGRGFL